MLCSVILCTCKRLFFYVLCWGCFGFLCKMQGKEKEELKTWFIASCNTLSGLLVFYLLGLKLSSLIFKGLFILIWKSERLHFKNGSLLSQRRDFFQSFKFLFCFCVFARLVVLNPMILGSPMCQFLFCFHITVNGLHSLKIGFFGFLFLFQLILPFRINLCY